MKKLHFILILSICSVKLFSQIKDVEKGAIMSIRDKAKVDLMEHVNGYQALRSISNIAPTVTYRVIYNGTIGDFYYDPTDASSNDDSAMVVVAPGGKRFKRYVENYVDVRWFGANPAENTTDDYPYIQRAIDWCIKNRNHGTVYIPSGVYWLSRGLLIRKDENKDGITEFVSVDIIGDKTGGNDGTGTYGNGGETVLRLRDSSDFCIGVQKGKTMTIKNLSMTGLNLTYHINSQNMSDNATKWTLPGIRNNRYSPNAGVVIDPFGTSAVKAANRYPLRTGLYTEVSNSGSTSISVENVFMRGFAVGIMNSPSGVTQNGECNNFEHLWISHTASAIAIGNQQNRTVYCRDIKCWGGNEVIFDHARYGDGTSSAVYTEDINIAGGNKWLTATTNWGIGYNHKFNDIHAELLYGIGGDIVKGGQLGNITLENCTIDLTGEASGTQHRAPIIAWCNILNINNSYIGCYSESDPNMFFVNAQAVIRRNCSGNLVLTQSSFDNTVFNELNINEGDKPKYYITDASAIANRIVLKPGLELYKNGYLNFVSTGLQMRQKFCGKGMNVYPLSGTFTPVSIDTKTATCVFKVGTQIYKCAPGAQVVSYLPDDITGAPKLAALGIITSVNVAAQTITVSRLSGKVNSSSTLSLYMYQQPVLYSTASFYIGDIAGNTITNITGDFGALHTMKVGQYFNHPAFPIGTYISAVTGNSITLSANALFSETGAFVLNETNWENTGLAGEFQAGNTGFYNSIVFKEGDILRPGYPTQTNVIDTTKLLWVCIKAGKQGDARAPKFRVIGSAPVVK